MKGAKNWSYAMLRLVNNDRRSVDLEKSESVSNRAVLRDRVTLGILRALKHY